MKKNIALRLASGLMLSCLLSTCVISGTFAKYTTSESAESTARVATWGFDSEASHVTLTNLFSTEYTNVKSLNTDNVIAPGTNGAGTFQFVWASSTSDEVDAPEVAYTFKVDAATGSSCDTDIQNNTNIKWAVYETGTEETSISWGTWTQMITAIEALDEDENFTADELPAISNQEYTVAWKWDFSVDATGDEADTAMGNAAELAEVTLKITITATQVD